MLSFSDYLAVISILFLLVSSIGFKNTSLSKFFFISYLIFTIFAASTIMINSSIILGLTMFLNIIFPVAMIKCKSQKN